MTLLCACVPSVSKDELKSVKDGGGVQTLMDIIVSAEPSASTWAILRFLGCCAGIPWIAFSEVRLVDSRMPETPREAI